MALLQVDADPFLPGRWSIRCEHLGALAAVPDGICQVLGFEHDALGAWALHPSEQDGARNAAYREELREIGPGPMVEVRELSRPWQRNVVWVDRYHLLVTGAAPALGTRLLGLYVGSPGQLVLAVHHPSVAALVQQALDELPGRSGRDWDTPELVLNTKFVIRSAPDEQSCIELRAPQPMAMDVQGALGLIAQQVAGW